MKLAHLGDAFDHWKGAVIRILADRRLLVVPMLTDADQWMENHLETYARLLQLPANDILKTHAIFTRSTRQGYFCDLGEDDLFLDPDTGISPGKEKKDQHIHPCEIACLLPEHSSRLLIIYQHSNRDARGVGNVLASLGNTKGFSGIHMFAYDCGVVSMVVISRDGKRLEEAKHRLKNCLGPVSSRIVEKKLTFQGDTLLGR